MKYALLCLGLMLAAPAVAQQKPAQLRGQLALPEFATLAEKASETVNVTLDPNILGMACRFLSSEDPEEAKAKQVCQSLRGIYVRHFTFDSDFAYPKADIERVVRQLSAPGWSQLVPCGSIAVPRNEKSDAYASR